MEPRTFEVIGQLSLRMRIRAGDVRITETDATTALVHVTGERKGEDISIDCDTSSSGTRLQIVQRRDAGGWGFRGGALQIDVEVPVGTAAEIATGSGDIVAEATLSELTFQSGSGDAHIARISGPARLKSASGDVRVGPIAGDVSVTTASGDVEIGSIGGSLEGRTASGDIEVGELHGGARAMSASGDITIGSTRADLSLRSVSGDIEVGVPSGTRVWFDLSSTSGDTVSDLGSGDHDDHAEAAFEIRATTVSGDIRIRRARASDTTPV
ncbi:MAG: DUF4097 family beta strand repeat-containing protein [Actinomycetota bacterium]